MFCYQCQETAKGSGCEKVGVCGKSDKVANLQDLLLYVCKGVSYFNNTLRKGSSANSKADEFVMESLFTTITNANFDSKVFVSRIRDGLKLRQELKTQVEAKGIKLDSNLHDSATWFSGSEVEFETKARTVGVQATENQDVRSLRELLTYGIKGVAAYAHHAFVLGKKDENIFSFMQKGLVATTDDRLNADELVGLVMECGKFGVDTMALLDNANTSAYGNPEITKVNIGVENLRF